VHPQPFLLTRRELVADALGGELALELRERQEDVQQHPTHRIGGVELLGHRHEGHVVPVEDLHQFGEVEQGATEAVDLVRHHHINVPRFNVGNQSPQCGTLECAARETAIVVVVGHRNPALGTTTGNTRCAGITLGIDRGVLRIQSLFRGLARVHGTAQSFGRDGVHRRAPFRKPKNTGPLQRVPVISRAIIDRLG
jgi:hypothetical protein